MRALFSAHTPTFPTVNASKLSNSFFEICQPPDDSSQIKQAVVATIFSTRSFGISLTKMPSYICCEQKRQ